MSTKNTGSGFNISVNTGTSASIIGSITSSTVSYYTTIYNTPYANQNLISYGSAPMIGYSTPVTTYHFMGEEIKVQGYKSLDVLMCLASIESIGWKYYESLIKNEVSFDNNIGEHLDRLYHQYCRDQKIKNILDDK